MNAYEAARAYTVNSIESAPPVKITRLLYEGAIRFLDRALLCEPGDPRSQFTHWALRADAIVVELRCALDHEVGTTTSKDLERLYLYCEELIHTATSQRDGAALHEARKVLSTLLDGWKQVELQANPGAARVS